MKKLEETTNFIFWKKLMDLKKIRKEIDLVDTEIITLLEKRFEIVNKLKDLKLKKDVTDENREEEILNKISSNIIKNIYLEIFKNSKEIQKIK